MMGEEYTGSFRLPNKTVTVEFIPRRKGMAAGDHITQDHLISGGMLDTAVNKYMVPTKRVGGGLINVLNRDEKAYLEAELGISLSIYGDFWYKQSVLLTKQPTIFNLSNPAEYIQVAILRANKREIAEGFENRNKSVSYKYVIVEDGEKVKTKKKAYDATKKAWKEYGKIEGQRELLIGIIRLVENKPISESSDLEWLQGKVESIIDKRPDTFLNLIQDPAFETRILIEKAVSKKIIIRSGNKYHTKDGLELAFEGEIPTFEIAVKYLDNPKNQAVRDTIQARVYEVDQPVKKKVTKKSK